MTRFTTRSALLQPALGHRQSELARRATQSQNARARRGEAEFGERKFLHSFFALQQDYLGLFRAAIMHSSFVFWTETLPQLLYSPIAITQPHNCEQNSNHYGNNNDEIRAAPIYQADAWLEGGVALNWRSSAVSRGNGQRSTCTKVTSAAKKLLNASQLELRSCQSSSSEKSMPKGRWGTATDYSPSKHPDLMQRYLERVDRCLANSSQRQSTKNTINKNQTETSTKDGQSNPSD